MFERISNGWQLAKSSWQVLMLDKELLVFPLLSGLACLVVLASFAVPLIGSDYLNQVLDEGQAPSDPLAWVLVFLFYLVSYFVIVFFNTGLIACAIIRFNGGNPTLADGFRAAFARLPQIFAWAVVMATVGTILKVIESRSEKVGRFVAGLMGMAWSAATYFVVPVLVVEKVGPFEAIQRSLGVLRKTWGEALVANFGIGIIVLLASLAAVVPGVLGVLSGSTSVMITGIVISALLLILVSLISSALSSIVIGALYEYAAQDRVAEQFDADALRSAFTRR